VGPLQAEGPEDRARAAEGDDGPFLAHALDPCLGRRVDIIQALETTGQTAGNWMVENALGDVRAKVHEGVPIAQPLVDNTIFPPMVSQMVKIGEETGELEKMLAILPTSTRTRSTPRSTR
jgi:type II secretory pathway component PulF